MPKNTFIINLLKLKLSIKISIPISSINNENNRELTNLNILDISVLIPLKHILKVKILDTIYEKNIPKDHAIKLFIKLLLESSTFSRIKNILKFKIVVKNPKNI